MNTQTDRRVVLARVPGDQVEAAYFSLESGNSRSEPGSGEVRVKSKMFGLNAGLRSRLGTGASTTFAPAIAIGDTPPSDAIGVATESSDNAIPVDSILTGILPWADSAVCKASSLRLLDADADCVRHLTLLGPRGLDCLRGSGHRRRPAGGRDGVYSGRGRRSRLLRGAICAGAWRRSRCQRTAPRTYRLSPRQAGHRAGDGPHTGSGCPAARDGA